MDLEGLQIRKILVQHVVMEAKEHNLGTREPEKIGDLTPALQVDQDGGLGLALLEVRDAHHGQLELPRDGLLQRVYD